MECQPCGKTFTGEVCYNQHLKSEKHKRKILNFSIENNQIETPQNSNNNILDPLPNLLKCYVCDLTFNSIEDFQSHSVNPDHAKKVIMKSQESSINCNAISSSSNQAHEINVASNNNEGLEKSELLLSDFSNQKISSQPLQYSKCDVCNKGFSGPEPYKQHMESAAHIKRVNLLKDPHFDGGIQTNSDMFCEPCKKKFTGQIPYLQHIVSDIHRRKVQNLEAIVNFNSQTDSASENLAVNESVLPINSSPYFCKICDVECTGLAPYQQHLKGSPHLKKANKQQLQSGNFKPNSVELTTALQLQNLSSKSNSDMPDGPKHNEINKSNQGQESDYVLPELAEKLNVMSTNELQETIKVFLPDESIDFDHLEIEQIPIDFNSSADSPMEFKENSITEMAVDEPITKTDSEVIQICEICDVAFKNIKDALLHFESMEHYKKKWHS